MPILEFECENGHIEEVYFKTPHPDIPKYLDEGTCKKCGGKLIKKVFSRVGVAFNGTGFYKTDYATKTR